MSTSTLTIDERFKQAKTDWLAGRNEAELFHHLVMDDLTQFPADQRVVVDIGCGIGFDNSLELQADIAAASTQFIGVEPDTKMNLPGHFDIAHRCFFEEAPIEAHSAELAYSSFVLEHIKDAHGFWSQVHHCLVDGGVCWGFTVDARHPFALGSRLMDILHIKDFYMHKLRGRGGVDDYENYPTYYRANSPGRVKRDTKQFSRCDCLSLHRPGQLNYYVPRFLRGPLNLIEKTMIALGLPGSIMVIRLQK